MDNKLIYRILHIVAIITTLITITLIVFFNEVSLRKVGSVYLYQISATISFGLVAISILFKMLILKK